MMQSTGNDVGSSLQSVDSTTPHLQSDNTTPPALSQPYRRQPSRQDPRARYQHVYLEDDGLAEEDDTEVRGLGLSNVPKSAAPSVIRGAPVASRRLATSPISPVAAELNQSAERFSQTATARNTEEITNNGGKWPTPGSSMYSLGDNPYKHVPDGVSLLQHDHDAGCPTRGDLLKEKWTWLTYMIIFLAVYSFVFSGIFLGIAIAKPRWGHRIGTKGAISYDTATFLSALFSKTVELSFATTFVATLGQILSRRAFVHGSSRKGGISIAEMNMRLWIMQPGTLVTHWVGVKYVIKSTIGITALLAAFAATFYTTAAEALVAPKLKFGSNQTMTLYGQVKASYGNNDWLQQNCQTPITKSMDPDQVNRGNTCLQLDYAGNGFRNIASWRNEWAKRQSLSLNEEMGRSLPRPPPISILYENTTVQGKWITDIYSDFEENSKKHGRLFQNITMVMPHANVYHAAKDQINQILQPDDLHGSAGEYFVQTAVPAPALNVICVGAESDELEALIGNSTNPPATWPVKTLFDDFFDWVQDDPTVVGHGQMAPWFGKLPIEYNTVANSSVNWTSDWVYTLGRSDQTAGKTNNFTLCGIKSFQYPECSTSLYETKSGGELSVHCNNDKDVWKKYSETKNSTMTPTGSPPMTVDSRNWKMIGMEWVSSVSLGQGISDGKASIARFLTQSVPRYANTSAINSIDPNFPTIAEGLAVLAGYTLLMASDVAPFIHFWSYSPVLAPILDPPQVQALESVLSYKDYASGYDQRWKGIFYVILAVVFALNVFCLLTLLWYFIHHGEVTDYTEPQNLFALAINSPHSQFLAGSCGSGPPTEILGKKWCVKMSQPVTGTPNLEQDSSHPHFYIRYPEEETLLHSTPAAGTTTANNTAFTTPNLDTQGNTHFPRAMPSSTSSPRTNKRRNRLSALLRPRSVAMEEMELEDNATPNLAHSPAAQQYFKLTGGQD